jgi:hypothetical protein
MPGRHLLCLASLLAITLATPVLHAGMPSPLPEMEETQQLGDSAMLRIETISFFVAGLLLCAATVRFLWNLLQRDFPKLPRLTFAKALAGVLLWGLLFVIVLTMISGARELMTPGAWKKQGFTYRLADQPEAGQPPGSLTARREALERLRSALWKFADENQGRLPSKEELAAFPGATLEVPESGGMKFIYVPGLVRDGQHALLAFEPELDVKERLALRPNGDVVLLSSVEIRSALAQREPVP